MAETSDKSRKTKARLEELSKKMAYAKSVSNNFTPEAVIRKYCAVYYMSPKSMNQGVKKGIDDLLEKYSSSKT